MLMHSPILAPSLLAGNHAQLQNSLQYIADSQAKWVHIDIMDGHFVPNLTFGPATVAALRKNSKLYFDTHLMLDQPQHFIETFIQAGSQNITIHVEPKYDITESLKKIKALGAQASLALNPDTPCSLVYPFLKEVHMVLLMTVQPGFGGQLFRKDVLEKIHLLNTWRQELNLNYRIQVDGGIDFSTAKLCQKNGADTFVAGTAFFKAQDASFFVKSFLA